MARTDTEDAAVAVACVCVCVCLYLHLCVCVGGWTLRERGGGVGNRSILQMLHGRSEWNVLWLSVARCSLTRRGNVTRGPIPNL